VGVAAGTINRRLWQSTPRGATCTRFRADAYADQPGGAISAFAIDPHTSTLALINHQPRKVRIPATWNRQ
jgi:hypothetical protein